MGNVYINNHVCVLPNPNRKWQHGQVYACTCNNLFRCQQYYDTKAFHYIGNIEESD
jgi:hypothetical protein